MRSERVRALLCALTVTTFALSACGDGDKSSESSTAAATDCGGKSTLTASGSTAQSNAMDRFIEDFEAACSGQTVTYDANGSGAGVEDFISGKTDFSGTDTPLTADEVIEAQNRCAGADVWHLPVVFGPMSIVFNLAEVNTLALDAPTLAKIFNGEITRWDDPEIARLNQSMPALPINVIHRSDESGSSATFQEYLDAASAGAWTQGTGRTWNGTGERAQGNDGVADKVIRTDGSISYVEWSFALERGLEFADIVTPSSDDPVRISPESVGKTIAAATRAAQGDDLVLDDASFYTHDEDGAYPIVLATYELVCSKYADAETAKAVKAFLNTALGAGQDELADHGYVPLPEEFSVKVTAAVGHIS